MSDAVTRARSCIGRGITYGWGAGDRNPDADSPAEGGRCDCSGFGLWCLHERRFTKDAGGCLIWWNTDAILADARSSHPMKWQLVAIADARPGDLYVYGSRKAHKHARGIPGHCAVITTVDAHGPQAVIDCRATEPAIAERAGAWWRRRATMPPEIVRLKVKENKGA